MDTNHGGTTTATTPGRPLGPVDASHTASAARANVSRDSMKLSFPKLFYASAGLIFLVMCVYAFLTYTSSPNLKQNEGGAQNTRTQTLTPGTKITVTAPAGSWSKTSDTEPGICFAWYPNERIFEAESIEPYGTTWRPHTTNRDLKSVRFKSKTGAPVEVTVMVNRC